jgi:ATP-dependent DNA helicase RecG
MSKHWIKLALSWLESSHKPVPHEINELDWKVSLSDNKDRIVEHLIAFANHPNGGWLVYGISDAGAKLIGVDQTQVEKIISR